MNTAKNERDWLVRTKALAYKLDELLHPGEPGLKWSIEHDELIDTLERLIEKFEARNEVKLTSEVLAEFERLNFDYPDSRLERFAARARALVETGQPMFPYNLPEPPEEWKMRAKALFEKMADILPGHPDKKIAQKNADKGALHYAISLLVSLLEFSPKVAFPPAILREFGELNREYPYEEMMAAEEDAIYYSELPLAA